MTPHCWNRLKSNLESAEDYLTRFEERVEEDMRRRGLDEGSIHPFPLYILISSRMMPYFGPLTYWLLQQEKGSVSVRELYDTTLDIYGDAWVALAMIAAITHADVVRTKARLKKSVLASKMENILADDNDGDSMGTLYHFWNYLFHTVRGQSTLLSSLLSTGYEIWLPEMRKRRPDLSDARADQLGIRLGRIVNRGIKFPGWCDAVEPLP